MAEKSTPKSVDKAALGKTTGKTTAKGPHGGGNKFNQMAVAGGFTVHSNAPRTSTPVMKKNVTPTGKGGRGDGKDGKK